MTDQKEIFKTVCNYVTSNFVYDYIKSVTVKPGMLPDIDGCWKNKMGICQDLSAMTCAMLRCQGIPARLMIGTVGANNYHAWVVAVVDGEERFFDPTAELQASNKNDTYTTERYY
jgi:transglutaminase-like putative cysteine protease